MIVYIIGSAYMIVKLCCMHKTNLDVSLPKILLPVPDMRIKGRCSSIVQQLFAVSYF